MPSDFESVLRSQIASLEDRRAKLHAEVARVEGHLGGLIHALNLYLGKENPERTVLAGDRAERGSRVPDPSKSAAWAFVLRYLEQAPPSGRSVDDIEEACAKAGSRISRNTLLANLSAASKEAVVQRVTVGRYRRERESGESAPYPVPDEQTNKPPSPEHDGENRPSRADA